MVAAIVWAPLTVSADSTTTTANGTWTAHPGQETVYQTQVKQPINDVNNYTDPNVSVFANNNKGVIPVKFALLSGLGPFVFESIWSDGVDPNEETTNDYSFLSFAPSAAITFNQLTNLTSVYDFTLGDCQGGSLRWQVRVDSNQNGIVDPISDTNLTGDKAIFIYYGLPPEFGNGGVNGCTPDSLAGESQSGINLLDTSQQGVLRFDTSEFNGIFYNNYAGASAVAGSYRVWRASLILDSGWVAAPFGDQRLTLGSATVNGDTFTPPAATALRPTCDLPPANIRVTKESGSPPLGLVNEPISVQPADTNGQFRTIDCKYMYNLAVSSLSGTGCYKVEAVINGEAADHPAYFCLK